MFKLINDIPKILTNKHKLVLSILFIWTMFMSFTELLGLGSLVFLVSIISNPDMIISKVNSFNLGKYQRFRSFKANFFHVYF